MVTVSVSHSRPSRNTIEQGQRVPDPKSLKIGDWVRILRVPEADLQQRQRELADNTDAAGWTADSIERIIKQTPIVRVARVDDYGCVWYDATIRGADGTTEEHSLILYDDDTWEVVDDGEGSESG